MQLTVIQIKCYDLFSMNALYCIKCVLKALDVNRASLCVFVHHSQAHNSPQKKQDGIAYIRAFPTNMFDLINIRPVEHSRTEAGRRRWPASPSPPPPPLLPLSSSTSPPPLLLSLSLVLVSLSRPLARQEPDLSNVLGLLSQVHTPLPVCLSYWFSPLPHGLSLWIFSAC